MPTRPASFRPRPATAAVARVESARPSASKRGYDRHWQRASKAYLRQHPLCVECQRGGTLTRATVVDHITPHRGDTTLFWDQDGNWQSLCGHHHNSKTARGE